MSPPVDEQPSTGSRPQPWMLLAAVITLGALARLYAIQAPPFGHHWYRQYDTAAIARNFAQGSMNPLYPQVDWRGDSTGFVESEFPIYTFGLALLYRAFGVHEWLGRALNVLVYGLSALLLYRLAARLFDERVAVLAVFFYSASPLSVFFTRSVQPDALMCLGCLAGVYFFRSWTDEGRPSHLAMSALSVTIAILIKPFMAYMALPLGYLAHRRYGWRALRLEALWLFAAAAVLPALLWYRHALELWEKHGNTLFRGYARLAVPALADPFWPAYLKTLVERTVSLIATPFGLLFLAVGLVAGRPRQDRVLEWWAAGFLASVVLVNEAHSDHDYYQLPIVFAASIWMARGAALLWGRGPIPRALVALLCVSAAAFSAWRLRPWYAIEPIERDAFAFGRRLAELTEPEALIAMVEPEEDTRRGAWFQHRFAPGEYLMYVPIHLYLSHRKGWSLAEVSRPLLERLRGRGARYLATPEPELLDRDPAVREWLDSTQVVLERTPRWAVYRLR